MKKIAIVLCALGMFAGTVSAGDYPSAEKAAGEELMAASSFKWRNVAENTAVGLGCVALGCAAGELARKDLLGVMVTIGGSYAGLWAVDTLRNRNDSSAQRKEMLVSAAVIVPTVVAVAKCGGVSLFRAGADNAIENVGKAGSALALFTWATKKDTQNK